MKHNVRGERDSENTLEERKVMGSQIWQIEVRVLGKLPQTPVKGYFKHPGAGIQLLVGRARSRGHWL